MAKSHSSVLSRSIEAWRTPARMRLAVRGFLALAVLLAVTITATSATLLYNAATALRDEAEGAATHLAELLSASFAEMGEISLANVARTLDATLDGQMIAQARIAAHLVAAAEEAGFSTRRASSRFSTTSSRTPCSTSSGSPTRPASPISPTCGTSGATSSRSSSIRTRRSSRRRRSSTSCSPRRSAATTSSRSRRRCGRSIRRSTSTSASAVSTSRGSCRSGTRSCSASRRS